MLTRWIGAVLCGLALAGGGVLWGLMPRRRAGALADALRAVELLESEIVLYERLLEQAIERNKDASRFLTALTEQPQPVAAQAWSAAAKSVGLEKASGEILLTLLQDASKAEKGSDAAFAAAKQQLAHTLRRETELWQKDGRLRIKLGFLLGAAAVVLLI